MYTHAWATCIILITCTFFQGQQNFAGRAGEPLPQLLQGRTCLSRAINTHMWLLVAFRLELTISYLSLEAQWLAKY